MNKNDDAHKMVVVVSKSCCLVVVRPFMAANVLLVLLGKEPGLKFGGGGGWIDQMATSTGLWCLLAQQ